MAAVADVMRQVQADCEADASALDHTTFSPRGVGEALGAILAMVAAVARGAELLAERVEMLAEASTDA